MKIDYNKKYLTIAAYAVGAFAVCLVLVLLVLRADQLLAIGRKAWAAVVPIVWGLVLAYLLNPLMMFLERQFKKLLERKKPRPKLVRLCSVFITVLAALTALTALISIIIPQLVSTITNIFTVSNMAAWFTNAETFATDFLENYPDLVGMIQEQFEKLENDVMGFVRDITPQLTNLATDTLNGVMGLLGGIWDFILGFIVMIYLLAGKEQFKAQTKKILYAILPKTVCDRTFTIWHMADTTFIGFISGKSLDSLIIGILCFIVMTIMKMPYAILIAVIIGVTNMIPFFGPIIGAVPSGVLILLTQPSKVIPFVIFIIILQQFDGNILGPKILGNSTGLPAFWVMFAIFIGGGLFGFIGMLIGVPVFAVLYTLTKQFVTACLRKKRMPVTTSAYRTGLSPKPGSEFAEDMKILPDGGYTGETDGEQPWKSSPAETENNSPEDGKENEACQDDESEQK